jgi:ABC-2 type transport system ATP-binding protein
MKDLDPAIITLLIPLIAIELGLVVWALWDLSRPGRRVRGGSRVIWALIILFVSTIGPILYLVVGHEDSLVETGPRRLRGSGPQELPPGAMPGWSPAGTIAPQSVATSTASESETTAGAAPGVRAARPDAPAAVACHGLSKLYPGILALDRLDLVVPEGSVFGLLGPNGAGKTTTLRLLAGLIRPTSGGATVAGLPVGGIGVTRRIGFLDQDPRYYGWSTGNELVMLVGLLHGMRGYPLETRTAEVMARVGLADAANRRVGTYSGGMRQRLGIAQALVNHPSVLILDEPVSSLDPEGRRDLLALISELRGSATILFSTHLLADVERVCDRVGILDHGRLITEGPLVALLAQYALPIYRIEPEAGQAAAIDHLVAALRSTDWATDVTVEHGLLRVAVRDPGRASRELLLAIVAAGMAVGGVERVRPTLEDVFLQLTGASGAKGEAVA